jgi:hypothetical protein
LIGSFRRGVGRSLTQNFRQEREIFMKVTAADLCSACRKVPSNPDLLSGGVENALKTLFMK